MLNKNHVWSFSTVGGVKRVNLESGSDLVNLPALDQKLWTALSCPVGGLEIDKKTLELFDATNDGQIRVPDVLAAMAWLVSVLKNPDDILKEGESLPLAAINDQTEQGKALLDAAKIILKNLGKENVASLTVADTSDTKKIFLGSRFNGDCIITEDTTADPALLQLINEIIKYVGSATDRGGKQGITTELLQSFIDECTKYAAWVAKKEAAPKTILPFGENTLAAWQNYGALKPKIDDFFIRCRLAAFDPQSTDVLNLQVARVESITTKNFSSCESEIAAYPLAKIEAGKSLPLTSGLNPAWENTVADFKQLIIDVLMPGKDSITEGEWKKVSETFAPFAKWLSEKEGAAVEPLGIGRLNEILLGSGKEQLVSLIEQDKALAPEAENIILVDKLVRFYRDLFKLLKNFVTFHDFYTPGSKAIFQAGTLYIDQRSCDLCIKVSDMAKHAATASFSGLYLVYCDCTSKATNEKMTIVAALTNGDVDNLVVGKNALFYDRKGMDWDATVTKIVDNPISIRQAFYSPYRKVSRLIETQTNKAAVSREAKVSGNMSKGIDDLPITGDDPKPKKDPAPPFDVGKFVGIFAAIGLALGAIGTAFAAVAGGFLGLVWWKMPLAIIGVILLISGPSMIIAYLKLRKRNLAPILDANGWAINAAVIVNVRFGNTLTHLAELPHGAKININDPFTKKKKPILPAILALLVLVGVLFYVLWRYGFIHI